jgi:peptidoglycan L-alanyl-D-glutamate endopeptidase CwlK
VSRDLDLLVPEFRVRVERVLEACERAGHPMRPFYTLRTPLEQAVLWRQSRTVVQIERRVAALRAAGAPFLAHCIEAAGPCDGRPVTDAVPGLSWHQWGEAVDCFWLVEGAAQWSTRRTIGGRNGYRHYAQCAAAQGLTAGGLWQSPKDWPHVQLRAAPGPASVFGLAEIDDEMRRRFGSVTPA